MTACSLRFHKPWIDFCRSKLGEQWRRRASPPRLPRQHLVEKRLASIETPETPKTHIRKRLKRLSVRISENMERLRSILFFADNGVLLGIVFITIKQRSIHVPKKRRDAHHCIHKPCIIIVISMQRMASPCMTRRTRTCLCRALRMGCLFSAAIFPELFIFA